MSAVSKAAAVSQFKPNTIKINFEPFSCQSAVCMAQYCYSRKKQFSFLELRYQFFPLINKVLENVGTVLKFRSFFS